MFLVTLYIFGGSCALRAHDAAEVCRDRSTPPGWGGRVDVIRVHGGGDGSELTFLGRLKSISGLYAIFRSDSQLATRLGFLGFFSVGLRGG